MEMANGPVNINMSAMPTWRKSSHSGSSAFGTGNCVETMVTWQKSA